MPRCSSKPRVTATQPALGIGRAKAKPVAISPTAMRSGAAAATVRARAVVLMDSDERSDERAEERRNANRVVEGQQRSSRGEEEQKRSSRGAAEEVSPAVGATPTRGA